MKENGQWKWAEERLAVAGFLLREICDVMISRLSLKIFGFDGERFCRSYHVTKDFYQNFVFIFTRIQSAIGPVWISQFYIGDQ